MSTPVMVTERVYVVRNEAVTCDHWIDAFVEVADLIIDAIRKTCTNCEEYGQKSSMYVVEACDEGTFIVKIRPCIYQCMDGVYNPPPEVEVDATAYAHKFAEFIKNLAKNISNKPTLELKLTGDCGPRPLI